MNKDASFKNFVFISYSHADKKSAEKLQKILDEFHLPVALKEKYPDCPEILREIFRDDTGLPAGSNLTKEIQKQLDQSNYLVVICSPNAVKSHWVNEEIEYFKIYRDPNHIIPFIIEGVANAKNDGDEECFPVALQSLEARGANISTFSFERAVIEVIAGALDIDVDDLWQRHVRAEEERKRKLQEQRDNLLRSQSLFLAEKSIAMSKDGDPYKGCLYALEALPNNVENPERPILQEAVCSLYQSAYFEYGILHRKSVDTKVRCPVSQLIFSNDGGYLVSCSQNDIHIWNVKTGELVKTLSEHTEVITDIICFGVGEDEKIISGSEDGYLMIWNLLKCTLIKEFKYQESWVKSITTNGNAIVVAGVDWTIDIFTMDGKMLLSDKEKKHRGTITSIDCNNEYIVTGSLDKTIAIWDSQTLNLVKCLMPRLRTSNDYVTVVRIGLNNLVAGTTDGTIHLWELNSWKEFRPMRDSKEDHGRINTIFLYKNIIIAGYQDGMIIIWDSRGTCINEIRAGVRAINSISFNGLFLAAGSDDGNIYVFGIKRARLLNINSEKDNYDEVLWLIGQEDDTMQYCPKSPIFHT